MWGGRERGITTDGLREHPPHGPLRLRMQLKEVEGGAVKPTAVLCRQNEVDEGGRGRGVGELPAEWLAKLRRNEGNG